MARDQSRCNSCRVVRVGLSDDFWAKLEGRVMTAVQMCGWRVFQPRGTASAKAQKCQCALWVWGIARRPLWLEQRKKEGECGKNQSSDGIGQDHVKTREQWEILGFYSERNGMTLEGLHIKGMIWSDFDFKRITLIALWRSQRNKNRNRGSFFVRRLLK